MFIVEVEDVTQFSGGGLEMVLNEKPHDWIVQRDLDTVNPVVESCQFAYRTTNIVQINDQGVKSAARHIHHKLLSESYTPRTWRTSPLHICPPEPYNPSDPLTKACLNWIFLISALNFSFWSEKEVQNGRYGVEWRKGWGKEGRTVWTGYWSLVAALNRALEEDIPITDPIFYSSEILCPDSLIEHVFRPAAGCTETIPLLPERIAIMREVGFILCTSFGGSFQGFIEEFHRRHDGQGTALQLVKMVANTFPSFRDEPWFGGRRVYLWKRAQILVAEAWAAFYPLPSTLAKHPLFPTNPSIHHLTMFADYRVPQILHHLCILTYPPFLIQMLENKIALNSGSREEVSVRAASVVGVQRVRDEILRIQKAADGREGSDEVSSVLIDFYLWDLAKKVERGEETLEGIETVEMVPAHRTRSIWY